MENINLKAKKQNKTKQVELIQKPSGTIAIAGDLDSMERKFYNKFLQNANMQLRKNTNETNFSISLKELKNILNVSENDKHNNYYKKLLKKLYNTTVMYNILDKDKIINGMAHLLDNLDFKIDTKTKEVTVFYTIPLIIKKSLISIIHGDPEALYARINLAIIKGLKSKYSIILYELCIDYQNAEVPEMSIMQFKQIFGIYGKKTYDTFFFKIRERVLDPAIKELNENPNIEFTVNYELFKKANTYTHIKFTIKLKSQQKVLEQCRDNQHLKILINALPEEERTKSIEAYLAKCLKDYDARYLLHQIEYVSQQKPKSFFAYLKKAIEEDYAKSELAEEQEKAEKERIERLIQQELEKLEAEKLSLIDIAVDREKDRIYEEYVSLLENNEKQELFNEYRVKTKELYQDVKEGSFLFEEIMKRLITEYIISKNEIYQKRLEKIQKDAEEKAERAYQREKETLREKIENGYVRLPLTI